MKTVKVFLKAAIKKLVNKTGYKILKKERWDEKYDSYTHNTPEHMDRLFNDEYFLKKYKSEHRTNLYKYIVKEVAQHVGSNIDGTSLADVGCGPGYFISFLSNYEASLLVTGYEYSQVAADIAKKNNPAANIIVHDIHKPLNEKFDVLICSQTLEHVYDPELCLRNIIKACKRDGLIVLTVPDGRRDSYKGHINFWSPESWRLFLQKHSGSMITDCLPSLDFNVISSSESVDFLVGIIKL